MRNSKENPFRKYFEYLHELGEMSEEESALYYGIGREFIALIDGYIYSRWQIMVIGNV